MDGDAKRCKFCEHAVEADRQDYGDPPVCWVCVSPSPSQLARAIRELRERIEALEAHPK